MYSIEYLAEYSRLHSQLGQQGWAPASFDPEKWIEADFGSLKRVLKIATQGRGSGGEWTTLYKLWYENDNGASYVVGYDGQETVFTGNSDSNTVVTNDIEPSFEGRKVRLFPQSSVGDIVLRWELYGQHVETYGIFSECTHSY